MDAQTKIIKPNLRSNIWTFIQAAFVIFLVYALFGFKLNDGSVIIIISIMLLYVIVFIVHVTRRIVITSDSIEQTSWFQTQSISLQLVRGVSVIPVMGFGVWLVWSVELLVGLASQSTSWSFSDKSQLLVNTNEVEFKIGVGISDSQLNEAVAFILEQIRTHYPENYAVMEAEKKQKEREAVAEFWRK